MKRMISILLAALCLLSLNAVAFAEHYTSSGGWSVEYTSGGDLESNFKPEELSELINSLQPGDDLTVTVTLKSENGTETDWYMLNEVLKSLESDSTTASGGAYTYKLTYTGPSETKVLYDSDTVGGEGESSAGEGLKEATSALKDYFFLDTLGSGDSASITLSVALDGESQGNRYQDTKAKLKMRFAVQQRGKKTAVRTGDDTNLTPLYAVSLLSGVGLLIFGIRDLRTRKKGVDGTHGGKERQTT